VPFPLIIGLVVGSLALLATAGAVVFSVRNTGSEPPTHTPITLPSTGGDVPAAAASGLPLASPAHPLPSVTPRVRSHDPVTLVRQELAALPLPPEAHALWSVEPGTPYPDADPTRLHVPVLLRSHIPTSVPGADVLYANERYTFMITPSVRLVEQPSTEKIVRVAHISPAAVGTALLVARNHMLSQGFASRLNERVSPGEIRHPPDDVTLYVVDPESYGYTYVVDVKKRAVVSEFD